MALTDHLLLGYLRDAVAPGEELDAESSLFSSGMLDSMSMIGLIAFVEESADIQIRSEDVTLANFDTPDRILRFAGSQR